MHCRGGETAIPSPRRRYRADHIHVLASWSDERTFEQLRRGLRESITRRLNAHHLCRWLVQRGSRKQLRDRPHFVYLMDVYLPKHNGWKWREGVGFYR